MQVVHLIQPSAGPRPPWHTLDQRSDVACKVVKRLGEGHHAIILGGGVAGADAIVLGAAPLVRIAPIMGQSWQATRQISRILRQLHRDDVVVGWGRQFRSLIDIARPTGPRLVVDLSSGVIRARSSGISAWEMGPTLPARFNLETGANVQCCLEPPETGAFRLGLYSDGPEVTPTLTFSFILGVLGTAGMRVEACLRRDATELRRVIRQERDGGRVARVFPVNSPLLHHAADCCAWVCALSPRWTQGLTPRAAWSTLLGGDALAATCPRVAAVRSAAQWLDESLQPRVRMIEGDALSDAASVLIHMLESPVGEPAARKGADVVSELRRAIRRVAQGQSIRMD